MVKATSADERLASDRIGAFFVGVGKCGTSWIYNFLGACDQVEVPTVKEPYIVDMDVGQQEPAIRRLYPPSRGHMRAEFSNTYYADLSNPAKIFRHNPDARIVVTVRQPSERVVSHFRFLSRNGLVDPESFSTYLESDEHGLIERSDYRPIVQRYQDQFGQASIVILPLELLRQDPAEYVKRLGTHLGVELPVPTAEQREPSLAAQGARVSSLNRQVHRVGMLARRLGLLRLHAAVKQSTLVRKLLFTDAPPAEDYLALARSNPQVKALDDDYETFLRDLDASFS